MISGIFSIPIPVSEPAGDDAERSAVVPVNGAAGHFVAGPENALVRVLAEAVRAETPPYNPVVITGAASLGKTALLHALVESRKLVWPSTQVVFTTAVDFARAHRYAYDTDSLSDWRSKQQRLGLLAIDDVHRLANKPAAQVELCSILDALVRRGSLVLATLRRSPAEVRGLAAGLVSRLSGGLIVPLVVPESPARRAIVTQVAQQLDVPLPDEVLERLTTVPAGKRPPFSTPAQLRHAVLELAHLANSTQTNINVQLVDDLIRQHTPETKGTMRQITAIVAKQMQLPVGDLRGQSRQQNIVRARSLAMYLCRELTGASFAEVGRHFGGRDHTTVMHACRKTAQQIETEPSFKELVDDLSSQIALSHETV